MNDGYSDRSGRICDELEVNDTRITVIHQANKGYVKARKAGFFSDEAQRTKYIMTCDVDDTMPADAIMNLYLAAEQYNVDCVCGRMIKVWKQIRLPETYCPPCFDITGP